MEHAVLLVGRWIGLTHDAWRATLARRRPLAAEMDALRVQMEKLKVDNDLLRSRLLRLNGHTRPHYRPWERLQILAPRAIRNVVAWWRTLKEEYRASKRLDLAPELAQGHQKFPSQRPRSWR